VGKLLHAGWIIGYDAMIAIDSKVLRRSLGKGIGKAAIDMVSAWETANHVVLGPVKVD